MHILITGASGSVGSHVLAHLIAQGHTVLASDIKPLPTSDSALQYMPYVDARSSFGGEGEGEGEGEGAGRGNGGSGKRWMLPPGNGFVYLDTTDYHQVELAMLGELTELREYRRETRRAEKNSIRGKQLVDQVRRRLSGKSVQGDGGQASQAEGDGASRDGDKGKMVTQEDEQEEECMRVDELQGKKVEGVIHLAAVLNPIDFDLRFCHNMNVVSSYNLLCTAGMLGIRRIVQASSINATGLLFSSERNRKFEELPLHEKSPMTPEDPYSLSKQICENQADAIARAFPDVRICSLRFHAVGNESGAIAGGQRKDLYSFTSFDAASRACELGLTADYTPEFITGHEAFYILDDSKIYFGKESWENLHDGEKKGRAVWKDVDWDPDTVDARTLLEACYPGTKVREGWWTETNPRRAFFDASKAKRLLGWSHD